MRASARRRLAPWFAALSLGGAISQSAVFSETLNGAGVEPMTVALGALELSAPNGCAVAYSASVVTTLGEGLESFELQVVDDGAITQIVSLTAPADGAVHLVQGAFKLARFPAQESPGIGVYLVDEGLILDAVDPFGVPCSAPDVPALAGTGFLTLGGVLALAALVMLRRSRRAHPATI